MNFTGINTLGSTLKRNLSGPIAMMISLLLLLMTLISSLDLWTTFLDDRGHPLGGSMLYKLKVYAVSPPFFNRRNCCQLSKPKAPKLFTNLPNPILLRYWWMYSVRVLSFQLLVCILLNYGVFFLPTRSLSWTPEVSLK